MPSKRPAKPRLIKTDPKDLEREVRRRFIKSAIVRTMSEPEIVDHLVRGITNPAGRLQKCHIRTARADYAEVLRSFGRAIPDAAAADAEIGVCLAQYNLLFAEALKNKALAVAKGVVDQRVRIAASQSVRFAALAPARKGDEIEDLEAAARLAELRRMSDEDLDAELASLDLGPVLTVHAGGRR